MLAWQASGGVLGGDSWGTQRSGGLTEAQIREELQNSGPDEIPAAVRNASNTIAWWKGRQAVIDLKVMHHHGLLRASLICLTALMFAFDMLLVP